MWQVSLGAGARRKVCGAGQMAQPSLAAAFDARARGLTAAGHEFVDSACNEYRRRLPMQQACLSDLLGALQTNGERIGRVKQGIIKPRTGSGEATGRYGGREAQAASVIQDEWRRQLRAYCPM